MIKEKLYDVVRRAPFMQSYRQKRQVNRTKSCMLSEKDIISAEKDYESKKNILLNYKNRFPEKSEMLVKDINAVLDAQHYTSEEKKEIAEDMFFYYFAYGFSPYEYMGYEFPTKSKEERLEFESERGSICYGYSMNNIDTVRLLSNKNATYNLLKKYFRRETISIKTNEDKDKFMSFIERHSVFVRKLVDESCGRSVEKVDINKIECTTEQLFELYISQGENIIEQLVVQNEIMSKINASSVNTIRCITVRTKNGLETPFCFLKAGRAGAFVDNGGAGGILVGIDEKTGVLNTDGYDELNRRYEYHPDSQIKFIGYELPKWEEMIDMCKEMANLIPDARFIGWDTAYTDDGWVVIEGNAISEVIGPQITSKKGIKLSLEKYLKAK